MPEHVIGDPSATIAALQAQLGATQSILVSHKDRIKSLESLLAEHEAIKDEVTALRNQMEASKSEFETMLAMAELHNNKQSPDSDDDRNSDWGDVKKGGRRRPKSPEQGSDSNMDDNGQTRSSLLARSTSNRSMSSTASQHKANEDLLNQNNALTARLDSIMAELDQALELSKGLQRQHAEATATVKTLEKQVVALEKDMATKVADTAGKFSKAAEDRWENWRVKFEEGWRKEKEGWDQERARLKGVVREWEEASRRAQEEEEERMMNGRLSSESEEDESDDNGPTSPRGDDWIATGLNARGGSPFTGGPLIRPPDRSHSASPRSSSSSSSSKHSGSKIRRESSTRLDPALRALRAAAGDALPSAGSPNGVSTPRTNGPTSAEGALGALKARSARSKRATTITGRKRDPARKNSGNEAKALQKLRLTPSDSTATLMNAEDDVPAEDDHAKEPSEGTSTGESDETAHEQSKPDSPYDASEKTEKAGTSALEKRDGAAGPTGTVMQHVSLPVLL